VPSHQCEITACFCYAFSKIFENNLVPLLTAPKCKISIRCLTALTLPARIGIRKPPKVLFVIMLWMKLRELGIRKAIFAKIDVGAHPAFDTCRGIPSVAIVASPDVFCLNYEGKVVRFMFGMMFG
jgi:hypothetical protein